MATQLHFVVMYDEDRDEFFIDYDSQEVKFKNAPIYNKETEEWEELTIEHFGDSNTVYNRAADALSRAVERELKALPIQNT
jgi:hypothetical protein